MKEINVMLRREGDAIVPEYKSERSSGCDLHSTSDHVLYPGECALVSTGLFITMPPDHEAQIRPRSGLALNSRVTVLNTPGTIDNDYRGEVKVLLVNFGKEKFIVEKHMRIAQLVFVPIVQAHFVEVNVIDKTDRGTGGFGSTGVR